MKALYWWYILLLNTYSNGLLFMYFVFMGQMLGYIPI